MYARTSGSGQKLEGVWKPQTVRSDTPDKMSIEAVGSALKVSTGTGIKFVLTFDGNPAAITGPNMISGTTMTGKIAEVLVKFDKIRCFWRFLGRSVLCAIR